MLKMWKYLGGKDLFLNFWRLTSLQATSLRSLPEEVLISKLKFHVTLGTTPNIQCCPQEPMSLTPLVWPIFLEECSLPALNLPV